MGNLPEVVRQAVANGEIIVGDGGTGSEYDRLGHTHLIEHGWAGPFFQEGGAEATQQIHEGYLRVGAQMLTANTFRGTETPTAAFFAQTDRDPGDLSEAVESITEQAVGAVGGAIAAVKPWQDVLVVGSMDPVHDNDRPDLAQAADLSELQGEHDRHTERLVRSGVDALLHETVGTRRELLVMAEAAHQRDVPYLTSIYPDSSGTNLRSGEPLENAIGMMLTLPHPPIAIGANCAAPRIITQVLRTIRGIDPDVPLIAYGQGHEQAAPGAAERTWEWREGVNRADYLDEVRRWVEELGATIVGGCCGTTPDYIKDIVNWDRERRA